MVRFRTDGGYPVFSVMSYSNQFAITLEGSYVGGTFNTLSGVRPSQTSWDQVEVEFKVNTPGQSNGWMRMWINGVLRAEKLNQQFRGPMPTSINSQGLLVPSTSRFESAQIYVQSGLGSIYYDRVAAGNTRIGLTTGQTSSDTTPPNIPTGVQ